ncbi:acyltransferase domain-containing protein [Nocardiopsis exhalans]|uniref:Acyltransferase domain-containing protein n=1 Tax=Nocardiopsis exhalans TaxID=163604 RepID=A0ABY5D461_9ACTN|nr:acyltransferase domain-containing protein [Nocardiopsis exhalans]USY18038.1 acyltransferase domain-containing protein [Nocardiopsis exhalans]
MSPQVQQQSVIDAALIGMSMRLPGAMTAPQLWQLLLDPAQKDHIGLERGPITHTLVRQLAMDALADASLPTHALQGTRTGVYLCTHPDSAAEPELAEALCTYLGVEGPASTVRESTAVPLLHTAHHDLRVKTVDHAIVLALDEHHDLTRAIALVLTAAPLSERHRAYAHITGTWTTTAPPHHQTHTQVMGQALRHAQTGFARVWWWNTTVTDPTSSPSGTDQTRVLPEPLADRAGVSGLTSVAATALALHHRRRPAEGTGNSSMFPPYDPFEAYTAATFEHTPHQRSATVLTNAPRLPLPAHHDPVALPRMHPLSASSHADLTRAARLHAETTPAAGSVTTLADTALEHADHHRVRAAVVSDNLGTTVQGFRSIEDGQPNSHVIGPRVVPQVPPRLVYVATGVAGVHPNAGAALMRLSEYAEAVEETRQALAEYTTEPVWGPGERLTTVQDHHQATYVTQLALAAAWRAWGLEPEVVVGCGAGEPAAAVMAGALSVQEGARVVAARSTALAQLPPTQLLLIHASRSQVQSLLAPRRDQVHVALHLHNRLWCMAGPTDELLQLLHTLRERKISARLVRGDTVHTPPALELGSQVRHALRGLRPRLATRAYLMSATVRPSSARYLDADYWANQLGAPAYLGAALRLATDRTQTSVLVEVAARTTLARPLLDSVDARNDVVSLSADPAQYAHALGELYTRGHTPRPRPAHSRANAHLVLPPAPARQETTSVCSAPAPEHVQDDLLRLVERLADLDGPPAAAHSWAQLELSEYDLVRLICELRQIPAWRAVTSNDLDPHQPLTVWAKQLATRLEDTKATTPSQPAHH